MIEYHKTLNPKLWLDNKLIPEVKTKLIEIYQTFINKLKENEIPIDVVDVLLLGSNASYNYTDNSDIDLHIVTDFEDLGLNNTLAQIFYNNEKSKFNDDYDISIKGLPVEVYIEDINAGTKSNGIYSLLQDKWIKFPEYNPPKEVDYSFLLNVYQNKVNNALQGTPEQIKSTINEIKMLRKISLMNDGEYSKGNLVFKELRNNGSIDNLYNKLHELTSKELSLEKINNLKEVTSSGGTETNRNRKDIFNQLISDCDLSIELYKNLYTEFQNWLKSLPSRVIHHQDDSNIENKQQYNNLNNVKFMYRNQHTSYHKSTKNPVTLKQKDLNNCKQQILKLYKNNKLNNTSFISVLNNNITTITK